MTTFVEFSLIRFLVPFLKKLKLKFWPFTMGRVGNTVCKVNIAPTLLLKNLAYHKPFPQWVALQKMQCVSILVPPESPDQGIYILQRCIQKPLLGIQWQEVNTLLLHNVIIFVHKKGHFYNYACIQWVTCVAWSVSNLEIGIYESSCTV